MDEEKIEVEGKENVIDIEGENKNIDIEGDKNIIKIEGDSKEINIEGDKNKLEIEEKSSKEEGQEIIKFFKSKKGQWIFIGILLLAIIIFSSWIRVQNLDLLVDSTTGENIPVALDPFYFIRTAEAIVQNNGLPAVDNMRILKGGVPYIKEILSPAIVLFWKSANLFGDYALRYIAMITPVIFFILGIIAFFFLVLYLTNSKSTALISAFFLSIIPSYLYRTMSGFVDHESPGMFAFFATLLIYAISLKFLEKEKSKNHLRNLVLFGIGTGFMTAFTIASWGGLAKFVFMIIPFSFLIFYLVNENKGKRFNKNLLLFYFIWFVSSFLSVLIFGFSIVDVFKANVLVPSGLLSGFVLVLIFVDYFVKVKAGYLKKFVNSIEKYRLFYSILITAIIGIIFLIASGYDIWGLLSNVIDKFLNPFGKDRLGLTVAENKQPYLSDWIAQTGRTIFYLFMAGVVFLGFNISKGFKKMSYKILFSASWIFMICGIVFSRVSANSMLNGNNFISSLFYASGLLFFGLVFIYLYLKKELRIESKLILIFSIMFFILIAGRGAIRLFFVITPFMVFMAGYSVKNFYDYAKNSKEEIIKALSWVGFGIAIISLIMASSTMIASSKYQAENTAPSANLHWQKAMQWVRENTSEDSIFAHWWDYGYWVEYLGERRTIADGGHFQGTYRDHMIGRYILTEPNENLSLSFMKSNGVDYLLIDQTDVGKYSAYSSIGSSEDWDRMATVPVLTADSSQTKETSTGEVRIYNGAAGVGEDIIYEKNGTEIFIPGATFDKYGSPNYNAFLIGVILEIEKNSGNGTYDIKQPKGVFYYNGEQVQIPLRYIYTYNKKVDFGGGVEAGFYVIPSASPQTSGGVQVDQLGAAFYFGPRTLNSLFVQLFILNDPENKYPTIELAHKEENYIVAALKSQGIPLNDFIVYQGLQGPIKIYEVNYPDYILDKEEFRSKTLDEWAEFDNLEVVG